MDIDEMLLHQAKHLYEAMGKMVDESMPRELAEIVKFHSAAAAAAALASGWIPGAGALAAVTISAGFVWSMYARIGAKIGLPFSHNVLKSLASGVATNLAANVVGALALSTIISFVPGLGSVGASVIAGATCYALTLGSGYIYLKVMTMLFAKGVCPSSLSEKELQAMAASVAKDSDVRAVMKEAKSDFRKNKGEL